jgi:hypothetical protein
MGAPVRTVRKMLLGHEIRHMLSETGTKQEKACELLGFKPSSFSSVLNGVGKIAYGDLVLLANELGFTDPGHHEALRELHRDNQQRGAWTMGYHRAYSDELRLMVDLEKHADQIRSYQVEIMPGLAQCEAYAEALHADTPDEDGLTLADRVKARMARQDIYDKPNPPALHFVLSESCLRRVWGDRQIMREQLDYLIKLTNRKNVHIKVIPFDAPPGRRSPIGNRFTLLRIPSPGAAGPLEVAYIENQVEIRYLDAKPALAAFDQAWARLTNAALNYTDTRTFIHQTANDHHPTRPHQY